MNELSKEKEEIAPLIEKVIAHLPDSKRNNPDVKTLIEFLKTTDHFKNPDILGHLLIEATEAENVQWVEVLLEQKGINIETKDQNDMTALHCACIYAKKRSFQYC